MDMSDPAPSPDFGKSSPVPFRGLLGNSIRFWEPLRLLYNFILLSVTFFWVVATWPHFRAALTLHSLLLMSILALIANACYSIAYLVDFTMQCSSQSAAWNRIRWGVWVLGTIFAFVLANYWIADEIYPDFR